MTPTPDSGIEHRTAALLIVDVQQGSIDPGTAHIPAKVGQLLPRYPVTMATRFYNPVGSNFRRLIPLHRFARNSPDFPLAFTPLPTTYVIDKPTYTCVTPAFLDLLDRHNIKEIHICGIDTDISVTKCAVDLFEQNLVPVILAYACASHAGPELHHTALQILERYIGADQIRRS